MTILRVRYANSEKTRFEMWTERQVSLYPTEDAIPEWIEIKALVAAGELEIEPYAPPELTQMETT